MIRLIKIDKIYYLKSQYLSARDFQEVLKVYRKYKLRFDPDVQASTHSNPKILLDCLYELGDRFDTKSDSLLEQEIENYSPFKPSFKIKRRRLEKSFFEKYPPIGKFQEEDVYKMFSLGRCLNANKMGLGKTYESIQTINQYFNLEEADCILIVAIPSVLYNWKREILKFSNYFSYEDIVIVNKDNRDIFDRDNLPPVLIMSYNTIKLVSEYCYLQKNPVKNIDKKTEAQIKKDKKKITTLAKSTKKNTIPFEKWGTNRILILDEAHKAKNMQARQTKVLHQIKEYFEYRFLLTGTPHPNNVGELYSLIKLLDDNLIESNYNDFISTIAEIGTRFSAYAVSEFKEKECNAFLERIKPYIIRRFLRDYVELPQVFYKNIYIEFTGKQYDLYQSIVNEALISLKNEKGKLHFRDIQMKFPYIIQMLSDPCLLKGKIDSKQSDLVNTIDNWKFENGLKFKACKDLLTDIFEENKDAKVVIWAEHPETINRLAESFEKYGTLLVHGQSTPKGKDKDEWRDYLTQEVFKKDKEKRILIANPSTLGTGTNLQFVQQVITFDEDFSFVNKDQKKSRFERFGMIGEVTYWKLIIDKSLDCYIDKALANKELLDKIFLKDGLTISDIKTIFTGD